MGLAQSLEKVAGTVIAKFGGDVTVRYVSVGAYDATTGAISEPTSDSDVKGVLEDVRLSKVSELVQQGDKRLTVAAKDLPSAPGIKDRVVISSIVHQIISVETTEQDNTAITYELTLRA